MPKRRHHASMYFPRAIESRALRGFCLSATAATSMRPKQPQCNRSNPTTSETQTPSRYTTTEYDPGIV